MGKQHDSFYILDFSSNSKHVVAHASTTTLQSFLYSLSSVKHTEKNLHIWHCRLGHPSFYRMSFLSDIVPNVSHSSDDNHVCIVCPLVKQKRLPFPHNNHLSPCAFDILHVDI